MLPVAWRPGSPGSPGPLPRPWFGSVLVLLLLVVPPPPAYDLAPPPHLPPRAHEGAPPPPFLFTLPYFSTFCNGVSLPGAWRLRRWQLRCWQGWKVKGFRRWRLTPYHRQRGCRSALLSSVCCHIGDFNFVSDLSVCPNALPLAVLHRTNTRTLTMFTRFII